MISIITLCSKLSCGECSFDYISTCQQNGQWIHTHLDTCLSPGCHSVVWINHVGKTCLEVRNDIFQVYPGMTVHCVNTTDPLPTDDDTNRYVVILDDNGIASRVIYNNNMIPSTSSQQPMG
jgi:hypothetical protein